MIKEIIAILMATFCFVAMVGCGEKTNTSKTSGDAIDASSLKGTTVDVLWWQNLTESDKKLFAAFEQKYDIKLNVTIAAEGYSSKLSSMVVAKEGLDVAKVTMPFDALKLFQDIEKTGLDTSDEKFDKDVIASTTINDITYGISGGTWYTLPKVMYFNYDLFAENGMVSPKDLWKKGDWNWDTFLDTAINVSKELGSGYYGYGQSDAYVFMQSANIDYVSFDGKQYKSELANPLLLKAWELNSKLIAANTLCTTYNDPVEGFLKGEIAMLSTSAWGMRKESIFKNATMTVDAVPVPCPKDAEEVIPYGPNIFGLPKNADNPTGAGLFLDFILDDKNYPSKTEDVVINKDMIEVLDYCNKQKKSILTTSKEVIGYTNAKQSAGALTYTLVRTSAAQINTVLEEYSQSTESSVQAANKLINDYK